MSREPQRRGAGEATTAQLRDDIDRGRTRDKVDYPDPAVAPLGTDDETAGTPPAAQVVGREQETAAVDRRPPLDRHSPAAMPVTVVAVLIVIGVVASMWV